MSQKVQLNQRDQTHVRWGVMLGRGTPDERCMRHLLIRSGLPRPTQGRRGEASMPGVSPGAILSAGGTARSSGWDEGRLADYGAWPASASSRRRMISSPLEGLPR